MNAPEPITARTADGWRLDLEHRPALGAPVGIALCAHAMMCDRRTLDRPAGAGLATTLAEAGFETYLLDYRGHGRSRPHPGPTIDIGYDDFVLQDLPAAVAAVRARHPDLHLALVGHSLGGHTAVAAKGHLRHRLPIDVIVSMAGNVWLEELEKSRLVWGAKRATIEAWGATARLFNYFPAQRLRLGTADEGRQYVLDWVRFARTGVWGSADGQINYLEAMGSLRVPLLSVVGSADRLFCRPASAGAWLSHAPRARITHRLVGRRAGDPAGIDHMKLVTDPRMRPVWQEIAGWMAGALSTEARQHQRRRKRR